VHKELTALMGEQAAPLNPSPAAAGVFLMAGLQGAGKTTTTGKLARDPRSRQEEDSAGQPTSTARPPSSS
jgi:signal recognition particle subunit SRP54